MSVEATLFIAVAPGLEPLFSDLYRRSGIALRRSGKLLPGDQAEASRLNELSAIMTECALASLWEKQPHLEMSRDDWPEDAPLFLHPEEPVGRPLPDEVAGWLESGRFVAALRLPHGKGETPIAGIPEFGPPPPAERWQSRSQGTNRAMAERFRAVLERALQEGGSRTPIKPKGITNSVLTETLREFAAARDGEPAAEVRVSWPDGSAGPPFPLRCLRLRTEPEQGWRTLRFTLLSIRHVDMDGKVDGAWLRNSRISRPRPAGETDRLVFEISLRQLAEVSKGGPTLIHLYQTGLETAVVGFYRALTRHLLAHPGSVAVLPCYYRRGAPFAEGSLWATL